MAKKICPLIKDECAEHGCTWYTQLQGTHPQTGVPINEFGCAITWLPVLLIENAQQSRQTGAAVESFRNEMVEANGTALRANLLAAERQFKQLTGNAPDSHLIPPLDA